jgi:hypothetical protein
MNDDLDGALSLAIQSSESITERASKVRRLTLLPSVSGARYDEAWTKFLQWKDSQIGASSVPNEEMLLVYFDELSEHFAPSSLWTIYSMLKRQMLVRHVFLFIDIIDPLQR